MSVRDQSFSGHASTATPATSLSPPQAHSLSCYCTLMESRQHESCTTVAMERRTAKSLQNNHGSGAERLPTAQGPRIRNAVNQPHKHENESERSSMLKFCPAGKQLTVEFPGTHHANGSIGPPGPSVGPASLGEGPVPNSTVCR
jgi:hypothetical protein